MAVIASMMESSDPRFTVNLMTYDQFRRVVISGDRTCSEWRMLLDVDLILGGIDFTHDYSYAPLSHLFSRFINQCVQGCLNTISPKILRHISPG